VEELILQMLREQYPTLDASPGSPAYEFLVRATTYLWTVHEQQTKELLRSLDMANVNEMSAESFDRIMARFFEERKTGRKVYLTARLFFAEKRDYAITRGTLIDLGQNRIYVVSNDLSISADALRVYSAAPGVADEQGYFYDLLAESAGIGSVYNARAGEVIDPQRMVGDVARYIVKGYVAADTNDGGIIESNLTFLNRVRGNAGLRTMFTYRGSRGSLTDEFNVSKVEPIGLRNPAMLRDLISYRSNVINKMVKVHRGGCADLYIKPYIVSEVGPYMNTKTVVGGYPMGVPTELNGLKLVDLDKACNPQDLITAWNKLLDAGVRIIEKGLRASLTGTVLTYTGAETPFKAAQYGDFIDIDLEAKVADAPLNYAVRIMTIAPGFKSVTVENMKYLKTLNGQYVPLYISLEDCANKPFWLYREINPWLRGAATENLWRQIPDNTKLKYLSTGLLPAHKFTYNSDYQSIHCDNLTRQMWPVLVTVEISIQSNSGTAVVPSIQAAISNYIKSIPMNQVPNIMDIINEVHDLGVRDIELNTIKLSAFYCADYEISAAKDWVMGAAKMGGWTITGISKPTTYTGSDLLVPSDADLDKGFLKFSLNPLYVNMNPVTTEHQKDRNTQYTDNLSNVMWCCLPSLVKVNIKS